MLLYVNVLMFKDLTNLYKVLYIVLRLFLVERGTKLYELYKNIIICISYYAFNQKYSSNKHKPCLWRYYNYYVYRYLG